jgi:predicted RNA methylase
MYLAPFVASPYNVVRQMLNLAELKPDETLYDLGCGDGRIVIMAAQEFGANAVGVELREKLAKKALRNVLESKMERKVKIINDDLFNIDLSPADVVTLYLTTSANDKIRPKLESGLHRVARVVSHDYAILEWKPIHVQKFRENPMWGFPTHTIYVYHRK